MGMFCGNILWNSGLKKGKLRGIWIWIWMDCHGDFEGEIKRDVKG